MTAPYLDTSALAKWYLNEARSPDVEAFLRTCVHAQVSSLTIVEMRCLLARRRRAAELDPAQERSVFAAFRRDMARGHLRILPLEDRHAHLAVRLLEEIGGIPLRSLDALHLALAVDAQVSLLATADRVMAEAATALGLEVARFDSAGV